MGEGPYHQQLHTILISKGYRHQRLHDEILSGSYDSYKKGSWHLTFWQDDYVNMVDIFGMEAPLDIFIAETNGIFDPDRLGGNGES